MAKFDRFDICEAHYLWAMNFHTGQFSKIYAKFGQLERMGFKMRSLRTSNAMIELNANAQEIYYNLTMKYYPHGIVKEMLDDHENFIQHKAMF